MICHDFPNYTSEYFLKIIHQLLLILKMPLIGIINSTVMNATLHYTVKFSLVVMVVALIILVALNRDTFYSNHARKLVCEHPSVLHNSCAYNWLFT